MEYTIKNIESEADHLLCETCSIDKYNWGGSYRPDSYGQIGLLDHDILFVFMHCQEKNPARSYLYHQDPVYLDSAMEFFIKQADCDTYFNFEINANGAMLVQYGSSKENRTFVNDSFLRACDCRVFVQEEDWHIELIIPLSLLSIDKNKDITFNFYKIKESEGNMHFGSHMPLHFPKPNFHLPQFFRTAKFER